MPVYTVPISQQNQAGSGGTYWYPIIPNVKQFSIVGDQMQRDQVTPTGAIQLYSTVSGQGTPVLQMVTQKQMQLATTTTLNDSAATRTQAFSFNRLQFPQFDNRTQITCDIIFSLDQVTTTKNFIGLYDSSSNLSALPTTTRNLGVYLDTSVSGNLFITSANGTTQVTTDSGYAANINDFYRLNIIWAGDDSVTINLYQSTTYPTISNLKKSVTVTSFLNGATNRAPELAFYVQTLTTAQRSMEILGWQVSGL